MAVNPDDIPRYAEPSFSELYSELTAGETMQDCIHCAACWRMVERLDGEIEDRTEQAWEQAASLAGCLDCGEYE